MNAASRATTRASKTVVLPLVRDSRKRVSSALSRHNLLQQLSQPKQTLLQSLQSQQATKFRGFASAAMAVQAVEAISNATATTTAATTSTTRPRPLVGPLDEEGAADAEDDEGGA